MKRNDRKYIRLIHFIKALKTDLVMSKYLYSKHGCRQYINEYRYNGYLLRFIKNRLEKFKELKDFVTTLSKTEDCGFTIDALKGKTGTRNFYRILRIQYEKLVKEIFSKEDVLYDKYINPKGEK